MSFEKAYCRCICHGKKSNIVEFQILQVESPIGVSTGRKINLVETPIGLSTGTRYPLHFLRVQRNVKDMIKKNISLYHLIT